MKRRIKPLEEFLRKRGVVVVKKYNTHSNIGLTATAALQRALDNSGLELRHTTVYGFAGTHINEMTTKQLQAAVHRGLKDLERVNIPAIRDQIHDVIAAMVEELQGRAQEGGEDD